MNMPNYREYAYLFNWRDIPKAFEFHGALWELIYLCVSAVILFVFVFFIEFRHKLIFYKKLKKMPKIEENDKKEHFLEKNDIDY